MGANTVKRIALDGALRGSAVLSEREGSTLVKLSLRSVPKGACVFTVGGGGIVCTEPAAESFTVPQTGICAAAVAANGAVISSGFAGSCVKNRAKLMGEIRIRAAEKPGANTPKEAAKERGAGSNTQAERAEKPRGRKAGGWDSPVTRDILKQAEMLFSALSASREAPSEKPAPQREADKEEPASPAPSELDQGDFLPVSNPFPKTFPGSVWRKRPGSEVLEGEAVIRGRRIRAAAYPVSFRGRNAAFSGQGRRLVSAGGKSYFVALEWD